MVHLAAVFLLPLCTCMIFLLNVFALDALVCPVYFWFSGFTSVSTVVYYFTTQQVCKWFWEKKGDNNVGQGCCSWCLGASLNGPHFALCGFVLQSPVSFNGATSCLKYNERAVGFRMFQHLPKELRPVSRWITDTCSWGFSGNETPQHATCEHPHNHKWSERLNVELTLKSLQFKRKCLHLSTMWVTNEKLRKRPRCC